MKKISFVLVLAAGVFASASAIAHIGLTSPSTTATQEFVFSVGHGCGTSDTYAVRIALPAGVTSVRPFRSDFGRTTIEKDGAGNVTAVSWQKPDADLLDGNTNYHKLVIRMKLASTAAFTKVYFPAKQTCKAPDGTISVTDWVAIPDANGDAGAGEPAPGTAVVPAHTSGWNKIKVTADVKDLAAFFADAQIVWKGNAAFSPNTATADQIKTEPGVTPLTELKTNDEIWVRY